MSKKATPKSVKSNESYLLSDRDYNLWVLLAHTRHAIFEARGKELRLFNISARRSAVLYIIQALGDKATPAEISRWVFRKVNSVSELINRMEKDELVEKVTHSKRRNEIIVKLTAKGRNIYNKSIKNSAVHTIMSSLSEEDREQLKSHLLKLRAQAMKEIGMKDDIHFPYL